MEQVSQAIDSKDYYSHVKQMVDQLSWNQRVKLKQELDEIFASNHPTERVTSIVTGMETKASLSIKSNIEAAVCAKLVNQAQQLTRRERQVLALIADGNTRKQVGEKLKISHNTAACHISHIYEKLGVSTIAAATRFALQLGITSRKL